MEQDIKLTAKAGCSVDLRDPFGKGTEKGDGKLLVRGAILVPGSKESYGNDGNHELCREKKDRERRTEVCGDAQQIDVWIEKKLASFCKSRECTMKMEGARL
jgi:hypothetical protein